jgi:glutathione peroxidase-family protein
VRQHCPDFTKKKGTIKEIPWNFSKFLLNSKGEVVMYLDPKRSIKEAYPMIEELCGIGGSHKV